MEWELRQVEDVKAILDDSGVYIVVHRIEETEIHKEYSGIRVSVRADLMSDGKFGTDEPIMSFQGSANAVRKALIRFMTQRLAPSDGVGLASTQFSLEHASYIGYELLRAELTPGYVQD